MESWSVAHKNLQIFCSEFWPSADDCQLILGDVGIDSTRIRMDEPSIMRWLSIIRELMRKDDGSMARLVVVLIKQYPQNKALQAVCAPWIPATPARTDPVQSVPPDSPVKSEPLKPELVAPVPTGAVLVKKFVAESKPVPVVVPADFADEAGMAVARIDTLWAAMIDVEQRLANIEGWRNVPAERKKKTS